MLDLRAWKEFQGPDILQIIILLLPIITEAMQG